MAKKVEVEGGEIAIRNEHGSIAIIPKKDAEKIKSFIKNGNHKHIDLYVKGLPESKDYALIGTLFSGGAPGSPAAPVSLVTTEDYLKANVSQMTGKQMFEAQKVYKDVMRAGHDVLAPVYEQQGEIPYAQAMQLLKASGNPQALGYFDAYNRMNIITRGKYESTGTSEDPREPIFGERHYNINLDPVVSKTFDESGNVISVRKY